MSVKDHLAHHWHHYSFVGMLFWACSRIDVVWEKTEWLRALIGWTKKKSKKRKRRHCK
jgi:hypothetical protein